VEVFNRGLGPLGQEDKQKVVGTQDYHCRPESRERNSDHDLAERRGKNDLSACPTDHWLGFYSSMKAGGLTVESLLGKCKALRSRPVLPKQRSQAAGWSEGHMS
jgi:hypothetical protein